MEMMATLGYIEELKGTYISLKELIEKNILDFLSAKNYYKHIPIRNKNLGWPEEVYDIADKCHKLLYDYCIDKKLIQDSTSYDEYLEGHCFCR